MVVKTFFFQKRKRSKAKGPLPMVTWEDDIPRSLWSADNVLLAVYLPCLIKDSGVVCI